jgi:hypothetical protein
MINIARFVKGIIGQCDVAGPGLGLGLVVQVEEKVQIWATVLFWGY